MYLNRARALQVMEQNNLDGLVATTSQNLAYLADYRFMGYGRFDAFAVLPRADSVPPALLLGHRALVFLAANPTWIKNIYTFEESHWLDVAPQPGARYETLASTPPDLEPEMQSLLREARDTSTYDPLKALARCLRELGLDKARLGFDDLHLAEGLKERYLPDFQARPAQHLFVQIRLVKTPDELQVMHQAARINQGAMEEAFKLAQEGADVAEMATAFRVALVRQGAIPEKKGFLTGPPVEFNLAEQHQRKLQKGDAMPCDAVSSYRFYNSDLGRTVVVGAPTGSQTALHRAVMAAFARVDSLVKPGINTKEIFSAIQQTVAQEGGDVTKLAVYCHAIGLDTYELNHHAHQDGFDLEPNVCFCVYILHMAPEEGGAFHIEEQYQVTDHGCQTFHTVPRDLIIVP